MKTARTLSENLTPPKMCLTEQKPMLREVISLEHARDITKQKREPRKI